MNKNALLKQIHDLLKKQENAIRQHPKETVQLYLSGRDGLLCEPGEWSEEFWLTREEFKLVLQYQLSSSFIAAWYHLGGDKANRDKATHSCTILVVALGFDMEKVFAQNVAFEVNWRTLMKEAGIGPSKSAGCATTVVAIGALILLLTPMVFLAFRQ